MEKKSEGIVLNVTPFGEKDQIANILGKDGIFSLIQKGKKRPFLPLACCEFVWKKGRGEIGLLKEMSLKNAHLALRNRFEALEGAMECATALRKILIPEAPCPELYLLLEAFLEKMGKAQDPRTLISAFYLKVLLHEGLLNLEILDKEIAELAQERSFTALLNRNLPLEMHQKIKALFLLEIS